MRADHSSGTERGGAAPVDCAGASNLINGPVERAHRSYWSSRILVRGTEFGALVRHRSARRAHRARWSIVGTLMVALTLGFLSMLETSCKREATAPPGVVMQLVPSKTEYRLNEKIEIAVNVTNHSSKPCQISGAPEVALTILSLTREGLQIVPGTTTRTYLNGFGNFVLASLVTVDPKASLSLSLISRSNSEASSGVSLRAAPVQAAEDGSVAVWPVDMPGAYRLTVKQSLPPLPDLPANMCQSSTDPVIISFSVAEA